ncbi:hypothetical protein WB91_04055 [bacteria symbiont BFo1 of Frankliniella occidentalis]|nr:hypothetical protein WB91_04055 [bacteria symbiont BFo1 of Frankliniella occidentalis]
MVWLIVKYMVTAGVVVLVSEVAKRSDRFGALLAALPLVTVLVLVWMKLEGQTQEKIASHAWYTFWYVVPTLPMFICFPLMFQRWGFWIALLASCMMTVVIFWGYALLLRRSVIDLI